MGCRGFLRSGGGHGVHRPSVTRLMAHCELVGTVCVLQVRCMDVVVVGGGGKVVAYVLLMPQKENRAEMCRKWRERETTTIWGFGGVEY